MKKMVVFFSILILHLYSCSDNLIGPENPYKNIADFVKSQNLPRAQEYYVQLYDSTERFSYFLVNYGKLNDPVGGGFYSTAYGIKLKNKIGWIKLEDYELLDKNNYQFYNVNINDTYLFSDNLFQKIDFAFGYSNTENYCEFIINDSDTPIEAYKNVTLFLYKYSFPSLAYIIIENPGVQTNKEILLLLANLPIFPYGDSYGNIRIRANELLNNLGGG